MPIQLSSHFTYKNLIKFTLPSIVMMIITQIYGVVDGLFVSNVVGSSAFAAMNLILPFTMSFGSIGFMLGTGGTALVARTLGEGNTEKANRIFSMIIYILTGFGIICSAAAVALIAPISRFLGATDVLLPDCISYGVIALVFMTAFMLQTTFQTFLVAAEKPEMGLKLSIASGLTNIILDYLFICVLDWGIGGAALGTGISQAVGAVIPLVYFSRKNDSTLRLTRFHWDGRALLQSCTNGASELMTNLSVSIVNMLYNFELMKLAGANGVTAYGVIMYAMLVFSAVFMGYSIGSAPVISFNYGARNHLEMKSLFRKSNIIIGITSIVMTLAAEIFSTPLSRLFVGYDPELLAMTTHAMQLFSISYLFSGFNMFASSFFTALNNGFISALISFLRTLVFQIGAILILPRFFGIEGIWLAVVAAEMLTLVIVIGLYARYKNRYQYL